MNTTIHQADGSPHQAKHPHRSISFFCRAPGAKSVEIAGDFNHWHPLPMQKSVDSFWYTQIELYHGHHQYRFLIDGQPTLDPNAVGVARDERGEKVSLVAVS